MKAGSGAEARTKVAWNRIDDLGIPAEAGALSVEVTVTTVLHRRSCDCPDVEVGSLTSCLSTGNRRTATAVNRIATSEELHRSGRYRASC